MKGDEAEYIIPLRKAFTQPKGKRIRKALNIIRAFAEKHTRIEKVVLTKDLNEFLLKESKNIPRKVEVLFKKDGERLIIFLKGSREIEEFKKKKAEEEKAKEKKKGKKEEKTKEEKEAEEEKERKKEEKKVREKAAEKADIKRKTGTR